MPTNLPKEYYLVEKEYSKAKTLDKKVELLRQLISAVPKHKGTEHLLADLRKRLSRFEDDLERRSRKSGKSGKESVRKSGDILVSIIGLTKSGKSTFLKSLTRASVNTGPTPYTTKEPVTGVCFFEGVNIQFVEIPSFFLKKDMSIAHNSNLLLVLAKTSEELKKLDEILKENKLENKKRIVLADFEIGKEHSELLKSILTESNVIRIFTKPIGKPPTAKAVVMKTGSTVKDIIGKLNENWLKDFKFVRIFDHTRFSGRKAGLDYHLKDEDIVEIHIL